jgi:hypothetical protein
MTLQTVPQPPTTTAPVQLQLKRQTLRNLDDRAARRVGIALPTTTCFPYTPIRLAR